MCVYNINSFLSSVLYISIGQICNGTEEFVKISKFKPNEKDLTLLYTSPQNAVTMECLERYLYIYTSDWRLFSNSLCNIYFN